MLNSPNIFTSFSTNDIDRTRSFYADTLGLDVEKMSIGLSISLAGGGKVFVYPKPDHTPASFTILNFPVENIDDAVTELKSKGVTFESYKGQIATDENDILRSDDPSQGPSIAWFKDPAGNILSVLESAKT
ncbi:VOC family protein [soil metagenome]